MMRTKIHKIALPAVTLTGVLLYASTMTGAAAERASAWQEAFERGQKRYQAKDTANAVTAYREALDTLLGGATQLGADEPELRAHFDDEAAAAQARYELGLLRQSQGKIEDAAVLFRDALLIVETRAAAYLGVKDGCKSCHYKQWKSWRTTRMAKAMESLKPGVAKDAKIKAKLDPTQDYTGDPECLACHATGYGRPGGYVDPEGQSYKVRKASEETAGVTCESCHGPGGKYAPIHKDVDDKARKYRPQEFFDAGEYRTTERICLRCHNARSPTTGPDYVFDYDKKTKEEEGKEMHEHFELIHQIPETAPGTDG